MLKSRVVHEYESSLNLSWPKSIRIVRVWSFMYLDQNWIDRSKSFMCKLNHESIFKDLITIELNSSKFLEFFVLALNNVNIGTPSGRTAVLITNVELRKELYIISPFFIFIFSDMFIILINYILFIYFNKSSYNKFGCSKAYYKKLVCRK